MIVPIKILDRIPLKLAGTLIMLLGYILILSLYFWVDESRSLVQSQEEMRSILIWRQQLLQGISKSRPDLNPQPLTQLLHTLIQDYPAQLSKAHQEKQALPKPMFEAHAAVAQRFVVKNQINADPSLAEPLLKKLCLGLKARGEFLEKILLDLFQTPISEAEFFDQQGQLLPFYRKGALHFFYFDANADSQIFMILPAYKLKYEDLETATLKYLIRLNPSLSISRLDQVQFGIRTFYANLNPSQELELSLNPPQEDKPDRGLTLSARAPIPFTFFFSLFPLHILYILFLWFLFAKGGAEILQLRFDLRLLLTLVLSVLFLAFLATSFYWQSVQSQTVLILQSTPKVNASHIFDLEKNYNLVEKSLIEKLKKDFSAGSLWENPQIVNGMMKAITVSQDRIDISSSIEPLSLGLILPFTRQLMEKEGIGLHLSLPKAQIPEHLQIKVDILDKERKTFNSLHRERGGFTPIHIMDNIYLLVWDKSADGKQLFVGFTSQLQMMHHFLNESLSQKDRNHILALLDGELYSASDEAYSMWQIIRGQKYKQLHQPLNLTFKGKSLICTYHLSQLYPRLRYLVIHSEEDLLTQIQEGQEIFRLFMWVWLIFLALIGSLLILRILLSIHRITEGARQILQLKFPKAIHIGGRDELHKTLEQFNRMNRELQQMEKMKPFICKQIEAILITEQGVSNNHLGQATVVSADLRGFTTFSQNTHPELVVAALNEYFAIWQEKVDRHQGVVTRFVGDAIEAVFFAKTIPNPVQEAVACAMSVLLDVRKMNLTRTKNGLPALEMGVGIAHSEVSFSILGGEEKWEFFLQGEALERSTHLETLSKTGTSTKIIVDRDLVSALRMSYDFKPLPEDGMEIIE